LPSRLGIFRGNDEDNRRGNCHQVYFIAAASQHHQQRAATNQNRHAQWIGWKEQQVNQAQRKADTC